MVADDNPLSQKLETARAKMKASQEYFDGMKGTATEAVARHDLDTAKAAYDLIADTVHEDRANIERT